MLIIVKIRQWFCECCISSRYSNFPLQHRFFRSFPYPVISTAMRQSVSTVRSPTGRPYVWDEFREPGGYRLMILCKAMTASQVVSGVTPRMLASLAESEHILGT